MITLRKRDFKKGDLFSAVYNEIIHEDNKDNKSLRLTAMAIANSLCYTRKYSETKILKQLSRSGVDPEEAKHLLDSGLNILSAKQVINDKNNLQVKYFAEILEGKKVHQMYRTSVTWRSARNGDLQMLPQMNKQMETALADRNMPAVYKSINGMQRVGYRFNTVIKNIPDWKSGLLPHEWGYLNNSEYYLKDVMYFAQTEDFRSRMYYRGVFNPSNSGDLGKAMFKFAEKKRIGTEGMRALEIHTANLAGIKGSINKRVKWTQQNALQLFDQVEGKKVAEIQKITGEKKIFQLYTALHEYQRVQRYGIESKSALIIKQDGSCNGIQHAAAILRNKEVAKSVNICKSQDNWKPQDLYQEYVDLLKTELPEKWHKALTRTLAKKPVMVSGYGAGDKTIFTTKDGIYDVLEQNKHLDLLEELKGSKAIRQIFNNCLKIIIEPIIILINTIKEAIEENEYKPITWLTLDRFPVRLAPDILIDDCYDTLRISDDKNIKHRNNNPKEINIEASQEKTASSLAVHLVHSLDATHTRLTARAAELIGIDFMHTHDEYGTHACDYFRLNRIIRKEFVHLHDRDVFESINKRNGLNINIPKGTYDIQEALNATYMFS